MVFIIQNTDTKKFLVQKKEPVNLTGANKEAATVFSNFDPYKLIEV
ncbi:hypothetical protein [Enterococcus sp. AZ126]